MEDFKVQLNRMEHSINKINISMEKRITKIETRLDFHKYFTFINCVNYLI